MRRVEDDPDFQKFVEEVLEESLDTDGEGMLWCSCTCHMTGMDALVTGGCIHCQVMGD